MTKGGADRSVRAFPISSESAYSSRWDDQGPLITVEPTNSTLPCPEGAEVCPGR